MEPLNKSDPRVIGPFTVIARLGSGGMGTVYLTSLNRKPIALKVVRGNFSEDEAIKNRFSREIQTLRKLSSPFIAPIVDSSVDDEIAWLAVDYVKGESLSQTVDSTGPLNPEQWWGLAVGALIALAEVHRVKIVHRDVKPANILMSESGPQIIDFGISQTQDETSLTTTGAVAGSPAWLAPEQLDVGEISSAADIFSLGSTLVYAATGRSPWGEHTSMSVPILFNKILSEDPKLDGIPEKQRKLLSLMLRRNPQDRASAGVLLDKALQLAPKTVLERVAAWIGSSYWESDLGALPDGQVAAKAMSAIHLQLGPASSVPRIVETDDDKHRREPSINRTRRVALREKAFAAAGGAVLSGLLVLSAFALPQVISSNGDDSARSSYAQPEEQIRTVFKDGTSFTYQTVSDSGMASLTPSDGSRVTVGDEVNFVLRFEDSVVLTDAVQPTLELQPIRSSPEIPGCENEQQIESSPDYVNGFVALCSPEEPGEYVARVSWMLEGEQEDGSKFERETITVFFSVRNEVTSETGVAATQQGASRGMTLEFLGGSWEAWDDAQFFSTAGNAVIRSWCTRLAPMIPWRDADSGASILSADGTPGEVVARAEETGGCTITGSVNEMEDGDAGFGFQIVVPASVITPRLVTGECLLVRFETGEGTFKREYNDVCLRGG